MDDKLMVFYTASAVLGAVLLMVAVIQFIKNIKKVSHDVEAVKSYEDILSVDEKKIQPALVAKSITPLGICTFFPFFGISCICVHKVGLDMIPTILIGIMLGLSAEVCASIVVYVARLKHDPSVIFVPNTAGAIGKVVKDIPAAQSGRGVIRVFTNNQVAQFEAISVDEVTLTKGTAIRVMYADTDTVAVVERYIEKK